MAGLLGCSAGFASLSTSDAKPLLALMMLRCCRRPAAYARAASALSTSDPLAAGGCWLRRHRRLWAGYCRWLRPISKLLATLSALLATIEAYCGLTVLSCPSPAPWPVTRDLRLRNPR